MNTTSNKIGHVAKALGVSVDTLRFYEREGLLVPSLRSEAGYRLYSAQDVQRGHFIMHAKAVGFSLAEIAQLLDLEVTRDAQTCHDVKQVVDDKIQEIESKILDLRKMKQSLKGLSDACCGGEESAIHCTILDTLAERGNHA
ncbi:Zn(II)-responsive transcriptional regulator [gamma proteobacterium HTCC5015]|nr:Zn(II)-responsive transcriptional regulator [gamma proteobacterium HTCC5015]